MAIGYALHDSLCIYFYIYSHSVYNFQLVYSLDFTFGAMTRICALRVSELVRLLFTFVHTFDYAVETE